MDQFLLFLQVCTRLLRGLLVSFCEVVACTWPHSLLFQARRLLVTHQHQNITTPKNLLSSASTTSVIIVHKEYNCHMRIRDVIRTKEPRKAANREPGPGRPAHANIHVFRRSGACYR